MKVAVKIRGIVATQQYGELGDGDVLYTDAAFARHLVEDCAAAEYVETQEEAPKPVRKKAVKIKAGTGASE